MTGKVPEAGNITRFVPKRLLRRDEDGNVLGIVWQALEHRDGEGYLSVTWVEHFDAEYEKGLINSAAAIGRQLTVKKKDGFSTSNVGDFLRISGLRGAPVRIIHEPVELNEGHAAIRRLPKEDVELLAQLAADAFFDTRLAEQLLTY